MLSVSEILKKRKALYGYRQKDTLRVNLEGRIVDTHMNWANMSDVSGILGYCTYEIALKSLYIKGEVGLSRRSREGMEEGTRAHERASKAISPRDCTGDRTVSGERKALMGGQPLTDWGIVGVYKGVLFRGRVDNFTLLDRPLVEEWKFPKTVPSNLDSYILQMDCYGYFLCKLLEAEEVSMELKVWKRGGVSIEEVKKAPGEFPPNKHEAYIYSSKDFEYTESILDNVVNFYTGMVPCEARKGGGCDWCDVKKNCPYHSEGRPLEFPP